MGPKSGFSVVLDRSNLIYDLPIKPLGFQSFWKTALVKLGPLAQSVEQQTFNLWVVGSIPTGPTLVFKRNASLYSDQAVLYS